MKTILVAFALVLLSTTAHAKTGRSEGLICKTPEAIESIFALHEANKEATLLENIVAENKVVPDACTYLAAIIETKETVASFKFEDKQVDVLKATIEAVCQDGMCAYGDDVDMFIAHWHTADDDGI